MPLDAKTLTEQQKRGTDSGERRHGPSPQPARLAETLPSLDGLRAVSILLVIGSHAVGLEQRSFLFRFLFVHGNLGVQIFFVISGFLITTLLLREQADTGNISLHRFYARRVLRIFPAFYVFIGCMFLLRAAGTIQLPSGNLLYAVTYTMNFNRSGVWMTGHLWSLSVEEQFYFIWPLVLVFCQPRTATAVAVFAVFLGPLLRALDVLFGLRLVDPALIYAFPFTVGPIAIGCLLGLSWPYLQRSEAFNRGLLSRTSLVLIPLTLALDTLDIGSWNRAIGIVKDILIALCVSRSLVNVSDPLGRMLNSQAFVFVGKLSYSLYLWQQLFFNPFASGFWARPPFNLLATSAAASASYFWIEKPFLRMRGRFRREVAEGSGPDKQARVAKGAAAYSG